MLYNYYFDIAALLLMSVLLFLYYLRHNFPTPSGQVYKYMLLFNWGAAAADLLSAFTISFADSYPLWANYLVNGMYLLLHNLTAVIFLVYVLTTIRGNYGTKIEQIIWKALAAINILFIGSSFATHLVYYFDENFQYRHGPFFPYLYFFVALTIIYSVFILIRHRQELTRFQIAANIMFISMLCGSIIIQLFFTDLLIEPFCCTLSMLVMNTALDNPAIYMYHNTYCYNQAAFDMTVTQRLDAGKPFAVLAFAPENLSLYRKLMAENGRDTFFRDVIDRTYKLFGKSGVYVLDNQTIAVFPDPKEVESAIDAIDHAFDAPIFVGVNALRMDIYYGVFRYPASGDVSTVSEVNEAVEDMLFHSHQATGLRVTEATKEALERRHREEQITHILRDALKNDGFDILYQPIYDSSSERFQSAEALVRLKSAYTVGSLGYIGPDEFIPVAERSGLILAIGDMVFDKVCRFCKEARLASCGIRYVEINLSIIQLMQYTIADRLSGFLQKYDLSVGAINLEVTETASANDRAALDNNLKALYDRGFRFSLDDYGSGYATASYLATMPFDLVKIDRSLVWEAGHDKNTLAILRNTVRLVKDLGMKCLAEGVETEETASLLKNLGCDYQQGYFYARPLGEENLLAFLNEKNAR